MNASDSSFFCPHPLHLPHFNHTAIKLNRHFALLLSHSFLCLSFFFHLLPLAPCVLFELSSIAGTSRSIYNINIGSESLHWCPTAVMEEVTELFFKTRPPVLHYCPPFSPFVLISCSFKTRLTLVSTFCVTDLREITMADRFDCDHCKESLYGRKYIQSDDSPYCIPCYDSLFSNTCDECKELIGHDARVRHSFWHDWTCNQLRAVKQQ